MTNDVRRGIEEEKIKFSRSTPRCEAENTNYPVGNKRHRVERGRDEEEVASTLKNDFSSRSPAIVRPFFLYLCSSHTQLPRTIVLGKLFVRLEAPTRRNLPDTISLSSRLEGPVNPVRHCVSFSARYWPIRRVRVGNKESRGFRSNGGVSLESPASPYCSRGSRMPLIDCKREPLEKSESSHLGAQGDADLIYWRNTRRFMAPAARVDRNESVKVDTKRYAFLESWQLPDARQL